MLGTDGLFGQGARKRLADIMSLSVTGLAGVTAGLDTFRADVTKFRTAAGQVRSGLRALNVQPDIPQTYQIGVLIPSPMIDGTSSLNSPASRAAAAESRPACGPDRLPDVDGRAGPPPNWRRQSADI